VTDQGSRQARQEAFQPKLGPPDILSVDAERYESLRQELQRQAVTDPALNGQDAWRRLGAAQ